MSLAVTRKENNLEVAERPAKKRIRGTAERSIELDLLDAFEPVHLVKAAAADYAQNFFRHCGLIAPVNERITKAAGCFALRTTGRMPPRYRVPGSRELSRSGYPAKDRLKVLDRRARTVANAAPGNALKKIRFTFAVSGASSLHQPLRVVGESFTRRSITYSKVTRSRRLIGSRLHASRSTSSG